MDPHEAARATERYFARELPKIARLVCQDWAKRVSGELRRNCHAKREVGKGIHGEVVKRGGDWFALVTSESMVGLWIERGTGIYGPYKRPIRAKGGPFVDAHGVKRNRRMLRWKGTVYTASATVRDVASGARGGVTYRERGPTGATYRASQGYIFAREVKGSPPSPWFRPGVERRLPDFRRSIEANMSRASEAIRAGGQRPAGVLPAW